MNITIILNGISKRKKKFYQTILPVLEGRFSVEVLETQFPNHAQELAAEAVQKNVEVILSAGGDGTLNQVLNGMMRAAHQHPLPALGLIPLGSGNDFAGTVKLTDDVYSLISLLNTNQPKLTDIGKVICRNKESHPIVHYFINVCSVGMGPATVQRMETSVKWLPAGTRYLLAIIQTFFSHKPEPIELKSNTWNWKGKARVVAVANGQSFGHKIYVSPEAIPDDGLFEIFVAADVPLFKFLLYLQQIKAKKKIKNARIIYSSISQKDALRFEGVGHLANMLEAEGELIGFLPAHIEIIPEQIRFYRK
ncbi:MAG: YegS/Rv2252/BmrU family lipid kinase [Cyclobacteriaceae bacterium]|jgi:diacylglycerol kinase (ATP)|nr:YegS/Rv2252/BmrU family lipid kinase [Cyclobacteriaceae bacterium]